MKVLFLDFDGVLNSDRYVRRHGNTGLIIDPARMELLQRIIRETDAKIVLSTSWREHWSSVPSQCDAVGDTVNALFAPYGLTIYDKTPKRRDGREQEIAQWLRDFPSVTVFAVLDDRFLEAPFLNDHLVLTSNRRDGLDEDDVNKAIALLQQEEDAI